MQALDSTRVGVTYHSQGVYHLSGKTNASDVIADLVDGGPQQPIKLRQTQPALGLTDDAKYESSANGFGGAVTHRF